MMPYQPDIEGPGIGSYEWAYAPGESTGGDSSTEELFTYQWSYVSLAHMDDVGSTSLTIGLSFPSTRAQQSCGGYYARHPTLQYTPPAELDLTDLTQFEGFPDVAPNNFSYTGWA